MSSCSMIRSSRCMFEPMSLMMIVSGWNGMVSPSWVTSCCSTPRSGSISTYFTLNSW